MVALRLFAAARDAAGTAHDDFPAETVGEVLERASHRYGTRFEEVLGRSQVWCNGEAADLTQPVRAGDEVAVLPPLSGG